MREIKFRSWDITNKQIFQVHSLGSKWSSEDGLIFGDGRFPIMQYTGLKDKNGKEIYEGDIVKVGNTIGQVKYCEDRFLVCYGDVGKCSMTVGHILEVIGNIYENHEPVELKQQ